MNTATLDRDTRAILFDGPEKSRGRVWGQLGRGVDAALDLLFPPHCASCGAALFAGANKALCLTCAEKMRWIGADRCRLCGDAVGQGSGVVEQCGSCRSFPPRFIEKISSTVVYAEGPSRNMVLALKFGRKMHVAWMMGNVLAKRIELTGLASPGMVVVPAPLTPRGLRDRGFNQAEELARVVAERLGLRMEPRLLQKIRATPPQATLGREKRRENLDGAFACNVRRAKRYADATLLLIDDVITTGSTVSECARTLHAAGLKSIRAASFARG